MQWQERSVRDGSGKHRTGMFGKGRTGWYGKTGVSYVMDGSGASTIMCRRVKDWQEGFCAVSTGKDC